MPRQIWLLAVVFCTSTAFAAGDTVPRKVLLPDFVNQANDKNSSYLAVSVPEALLDSLKSTGKFYLLPRSESAAEDPNKVTVLWNEKTAQERGSAVGADVVVIGNFVTVGNRVQIQAKAIDVITGQIAVAKTVNGKLDASIFDLIQKLSNEMSSAMAEVLPPIPKQLVIRERSGFGFYARDVRAHLGGGVGVILPRPGLYLNPALVVQADLGFEFLHRYFHPWFSFAYSTSTGKKHVDATQFFTSLGGVSLPITLSEREGVLRSWVVTPVLAGGVSFGSIAAIIDQLNETYRFAVATVALGIIADAALTDRVSVALALWGNYLMEQQTPLPMISLTLGVGYRL